MIAVEDNSDWLIRRIKLIQKVFSSLIRDINTFGITVDIPFFIIGKFRNIGFSELIVRIIVIIRCVILHSDQLNELCVVAVAERIKDILV